MILHGSRNLVERGTPEEFAEAKRLLRALVAPSISDEQFVVVADQLTELIATASRNIVLRMVRNGLTAFAESPHTSALRKIQASPKLVNALIRAIERAIDARDPSATEEAVRKLLRSNRELVLDMIAGPN